MHELVVKALQLGDVFGVSRRGQQEGQIRSTRASPLNIPASAALQRMFGELQRCCPVKKNNTKTLN